MRLAEVLSYDPVSGVLTWKVTRKGRGCVAGSEAGTLARRKDTAYRTVTVNRKKHYAHRVIWELVHGPLDASLHIDHIDGNGCNNRLTNLRATDRIGNHRNTRLSDSNSTGIMGVACRGRGGYEIALSGKYLGYTKDFFEACCIRKAAESAAGFHLNHGKR